MPLTTEYVIICYDVLHQKVIMFARLCKNMAYGNQSLNCFYHLIISFLTEDKCIAVHKKGIQYDEQMYSYSVFQEYQRV